MQKFVIFKRFSTGSIEQVKLKGLVKECLTRFNRREVIVGTALASH